MESWGKDLGLKLNSRENNGIMRERFGLKIKQQRKQKFTRSMGRNKILNLISKHDMDVERPEW